MGFNAPTMHGDMRPGAWDARQAGAPNASGYNADLSAQVQQMPSYQAWVRSEQQRGGTGAGVGGTPEWKALIADLQAHGIQIPENEIVDNSNGTVRGKTWTERHPVLSAVLITGGFAGGGAGLAAAMGGGAAAGGAAALGPTTAGSMAATTAATAVPASLAATGGSAGTWGALLGGAGGKGALINAGANVAQSAIAAHGASEAAKTQSAAADKSLAFQQGIYDRQAQNFAPYLQQGQQSLGRLGQMAATPGPMFQPGQPQGGFQMPQNPAQVAPGTAMSLGAMGQAAAGQGASQGSQGSGMVLMQAPDGSQKRVPASYVAKFQQEGARVVG